MNTIFWAMFWIRRKGVRGWFWVCAGFSPLQALPLRLNTPDAHGLFAASGVAFAAQYAHVFYDLVRRSDAASQGIHYNKESSHARVS